MATAPAVGNTDKLTLTAVLPIASVALAVMWLGGLGSVLAIVAGTVTLRSSAPRPTWARKVAWVGVALGIVGLLGAVIFGGLLVGSSPSSVSR